MAQRNALFDQPTKQNFHKNKMQESKFGDIDDGSDNSIAPQSSLILLPPPPMQGRVSILAPLPQQPARMPPLGILLQTSDCAQFN
jgi:hypothetical protein